MNSKDLLEQARENMQRHTELIESIELVEKVIEDLNVIELGIYLNGSYVNPVIMPDDVKKIQTLTLKSAEDYLTTKKTELEKLLGIRKPAIINPEFEEAVKDMELKGKLFKAEPEEKTLPVTIQEHLKEQEDKSLDKYPAKKSSIPPGMTEEAIKQMYLIENKDRAEIEKYFGVSKSVLNNFLYRHKIVKPKKSAKQPEETECP